MSQARFRISKYDDDESKRGLKNIVVNDDEIRHACSTPQYQSAERADVSSFPKKYPCYDGSHKKLFGYMKIENKGQPVDFFVAPLVKGLRADW